MDCGRRPAAGVKVMSICSRITFTTMGDDGHTMYTFITPSSFTLNEICILGSSITRPFMGMFEFEFDAGSPFVRWETMGVRRCFAVYKP